MSTTPLAGDSAVPLPRQSTRVMEYQDIKQRLTRRLRRDRVQGQSGACEELHTWDGLSLDPPPWTPLGLKHCWFPVFQRGSRLPLLSLWDLTSWDLYLNAVMLHSSLCLHGDCVRYVHNCLGLWDVFFSVVVSSRGITTNDFNFVISEWCCNCCSKSANWRRYLEVTWGMIAIGLQLTIK